MNFYGICAACFGYGSIYIRLSRWGFFEFHSFVSLLFVFVGGYEIGDSWIVMEAIFNW